MSHSTSIGKAIVATSQKQKHVSSGLLKRPAVVSGVGLLALAALAVAVAGASGMFSASSPALADSSGSVDSQAGSVRALTVSVLPADRAGPEYLSQSYTGVVTARRTSQLASKSIGRVDEVLVDIGDGVEQGQPLVVLDQQTLKAQRTVVEAQIESADAQLDELKKGPREQDIEQARAAVDQARSQLVLSRLNYARTKSLLESQSISQQEFDEAKSRLDAETARLKSAEQALDLLNEGTRSEQIEAQRVTLKSLHAQLDELDVRISEQVVQAPFKGTVQSRMVDEGMVLSPGQAVLELVENGVLEIHVGLPPELIRQISPSGLDVLYGSQKLTATVDRVAPAINPSTRTQELVLRLSEAAQQVVSIGSAVSVEIKTPVTSEGIWVPTAALTGASRGLWAVYVADPISDESSDWEGSPVVSIDGTLSKIQRRQVELLRSYGPWSEVKGPVDRKELLVVEGVHRIAPGQIVDAVRSKQ